MPPKPPLNEVDDLLRRLSQAQKTIEHEDGAILRKVERVDRVIRLIVWAISGIVALGIWMATIQYRVASISRELERRETTVERVNELWFMRIHGINNADAYREKHGKPPRTP